MGLNLFFVLFFSGWLIAEHLTFSKEIVVVMMVIDENALHVMFAFVCLLSPSILFTWRPR